MIGKADKLVANRALSALVFVCMVFSAFAGVLFLSGPTSTRAQGAIGDLTIVGTTYTIENLYQPIDGNVSVTAGGELHLVDATLSVISSATSGQQHWITIGAGGKLVMEHSTITTYLDQITSWPYLTLTVTGGGTMDATDGSVLMFPGDFVISNGAIVTLSDTTITALPAEKVVQYYAGSDAVLLNLADDGPAIIVSNSQLSIFDSSVLSLPEYSAAVGSTAANLTLAGSSTLLSVNSYICVDYVPDNWYVHNVLELRDQSRAFLYGTVFETYGGLPADRVPPIVTSASGSYLGIPSAKGAADNTGESLADLAVVDGGTYQVLQGRTMEIETWTFGAISDALPLSSLSLLATYTVEPTYSGNAAVQFAREGSGYSSTTIVPLVSDSPGTTKEFEIPLATISTVGDLRSMDVRFANNGGAGAGLVEFDRLNVLFTVGSDAFIYRWLNATVGDEYGVPIPNARISAEFTGSSGFDGRPAIYYTPTGASTTPPADVLTYMGETSGTFNVTKSDGMAVIPYLTDIVTSSGSYTNSLYVGSYAITGSATIGATVYSSTDSFAFPAYPAMESGDISEDFTVSVVGVSAPSPDPSRWLVVPPDLSITDMNYYHSGDIIVAAGGRLTVSNCGEFVIMDTYPYEFTIYVDGTEASPGRLVIKDCVYFASIYMTKIVVKGYGELEISSATLWGIDIVAEEQANVILRDVTMADGTITTSWDSQATISVYDSTLPNAPVLSGYAVGHFTDVNVSTVVVQDDAVANIYRWINVNLTDGAGQPLPGAVVSAYYYASGEFAGSSVSSSEEGPYFGVARVNSLSTVVTSSGKQIVGNYKLNASYTYGGTTYYATDEISVGVWPMTEPLFPHPTSANMTIPGALPDITISASGAIQFSPTSPVKGQQVRVDATILNQGVVGAYNVRVDFYDSTNQTPYVESTPYATATVSKILPGSSTVATIYWTAIAPLAPESHRIVVIADRLSAINESDETKAISDAWIEVQSLPDLEVRSGAVDIYTIPGEVVVDVPCTLYANVYNQFGDNLASNIQVDFWEGTTFIASDTVDAIEAGSSGVASVPHTFTSVGVKAVTVVVNPAHSIVELTYSNNEASQPITVLDHPDLEIGAMTFTPPGQVSGGSEVVVQATLWNNNPASFSNPTVRMYVNYSGLTNMVDVVVPSVLTDSTAPVAFTVSFIAPIVTETTELTVTLIVNPEQNPVETSYANNARTDTINALDTRPDLQIVSGNIYVEYQGDVVTGETYGRTVMINAIISNLGGTAVSNFRVDVGYSNAAGMNRTLMTGYFNISAEPTDHTRLVVVPWTINITTPGDYSIWVWLDGVNQISEPNEDNNYATNTFAVTALQVTVTIAIGGTGATEYEAGDVILVTAQVRYQGTSQGVYNISVVFWLASGTPPQTLAGASSAPAKTNAQGIASAQLPVPSDIDGGVYVVVAQIPAIGQSFPGPVQLQITGGAGGELFPWWVWIIIIVGVAAVIIGFFAYTYIYGLGKLVECGECGAFIPAASKRCPKCGVEFEAGTMKCSECGAWIPAESAECPNCGVKFVGEVEEEADYLERMRKEYDDMVSKYREVAKAELGKRYSEKAFDEWWRNQPGYISFEDWLAKEEEKKKGGPIPCPVCGTLNPKEATVCHKCGTVFGAAGAGALPPKKGPPGVPPAGGEQAAPPSALEQAQQQLKFMAPPVPRMVIRRPIDRKVIPKKIIKTPTGEETTEGGEENQ